MRFYLNSISRGSRLFPILLAVVTAAVTPSISPAVEVGAGAPSPGLSQKFVNAYFRNKFAYLTTGQAIANVARFGATGLIQEFRDASTAGTSGAAGAASGLQHALVKSTFSTSPTDPDVMQVIGDLYTYYSAVGVNTAGYPTMDTATCPVFPGNTCLYQFFDKSYVLFAYDNSTFNGQNFAIRLLFYTKWLGLGGLNGLGRATDIERAVTINAINATVQIYAGGAIYSNTSGVLNGKVFAVAEPAYTSYANNGSHAGFLGLPTSDDVVTGTHHKQTFQGGNLEWDNGGSPVVRLPVGNVSLTPVSSGIIRLQLGDSFTLHALILAANGAALTDRVVTWSTSNGRVATIQVNGVDATVKAIGGGTAIVTATSEGKVSPSITVSVTAPCCQIGEGAPTTFVSQAIQDAVTRNRLSIRLPSPSPVRRLGLGYIQELYSTGTPNTRYVVAKSDKVATAYIVTGDLLVAFEKLGGPAGPLGYPSSEATFGRQTFENASALAGTPVRQVSGAILTKWTVLGYEAGAAGSPAGDATSVLASSANAASVQAFTRGLILSATSGPGAGQTFLISAAILDRFVALGGAAGPFGLPLSDEFVSDGRRRQNFEGGYIDIGAGESSATAHPADRRPALSATPNPVVAGSRLRLSVSGFPDNSSLRISVTGQTDFLVSTTNGAYTWEAFVPLTATSASVAVRAQDVTGGINNGAAAATTYSIKALSESKLALSKTQGDGQSGPPGALLSQRLRVAVRDETGNPVAGVSVTFTPSPGAQVISASPVTDNSGQAEATIRLPLSEGVVLVSAEAARLVTTFNLRTTPVQLSNFPKLMQDSTAVLGAGTATIAQKGALLASVASIVRYHQNRGELPGPATDVVPLNQALINFCSIDVDGTRLCDGFLTTPGSGDRVVNLWRVGAALNAPIDALIEAPTVSSIRDLVGQGSPVLVSLSVTANGAASGGHYVVASGIAADGSLLIADPNPSFARTNLNDYLGGFASGGRLWKGTIASALRLVPRSPSPVGFLVAAVAQPADLIAGLSLDITSFAGSCGLTAELPGAAVFTADAFEAATTSSKFRYCEGSQPSYQLNVGGAQTYRASVTDFAVGGRRSDLAGGGVAALKATRPAVQLTLGPQDVTIAAGGVVNAATFSPDLAPGGLIAIFGSGLSGPGPDTTVEINGLGATVVARSPFQVNAQVPPDLAAGTYSLRLVSPYGSAEQQILVKEVAPIIFVLTAGAQPQGAVVNQDGQINTILAPGRRAQVLTIYGTGMGAVSVSGGLSRTVASVMAVLNGTQLTPAFAGLTPGFIGLYQVNLAVPAEAAPGLGLPLLLRQSGVDSNTVYVTIQ